MLDLDTITTTDFKNQFPRDFAYLPVWLNTTTYNTGDEVFYDINGLFYRALNDGVTSIPTTIADWVKIEDDVLNYIQDSDIERAFEEAQLSYNQGLFGTDAEVTLVYLYITAHYLVLDLRAASQGVESSSDFNVQSRSVGNVSESYSIPDIYVNDPNFSFYTKTQYGLKFLSFAVPRMQGNVVSVPGGTRA